MWLPKDERRLLTVYYLKLCKQKGVEKITEQKWYKISDLPEVLRVGNPEDAANRLKDYFDSGAVEKSQNKQGEWNVEAEIKNIKEHLQYLTKVNIANNALVERKLMVTQDHKTAVQDKPIGVSLTLEGYDLGRKYSSWWTRSGLRFAEYKHHWIWLIISLLGGVIGALLINWLSKVIQAGVTVHEYVR